MYLHTLHSKKTNIQDMKHLWRKALSLKEEAM